MYLKHFLIVFLSIILIGCGDKTSKKQKFDPVIPVKISVVELTDGSSLRNYVGNLKSEVRMSCSFPLGGTLTDVYVHNGQKVKKGDIIAHVDETTSKSLHDAALATLRQAEDGYERLKIVHEEGGISDVRWVEMETDLEKARQTEISTRKHLEDCTIYAPQDGIVSMEDRVIGEFLRPSEAFCHLIDINRLVVEFSVPEKEVGMVKIGDKALAEITALNVSDKEIVISDKSIVSNPFGHTYTVKAKINLDGQNALPGMVVKVRLNSTAVTGIVVPASCVQTVSDGLSVWAVKNGKSYRRIIEVSDFVKNGVLVTKGLEHGDTIVTVGYQKLYNGAKVSFK
ncbi:MAG: efflux RND transporter periplasmic adaptor subunit [Bacteroidales bacterium]|jgi:RND family efflux transporter MFP subunit|nr:efflux RND transporter periplasmic adaptor subunit [Bacteroidales bacterium]MBO7529299.1 efflux RND transporter periplasmic adaptor subunit [Bacteroidales bacterium]